MDKDMQKRLFLSEAACRRFSRYHARRMEKSRGKFSAPSARNFVSRFVKPARWAVRRMTKAHDAKNSPRDDLPPNSHRKFWLSARSEAAKSKSPSWATKTRKRQSPGIVPHREFYDYAAKYLKKHGC